MTRTLRRYALAFLKQPMDWSALMRQGAIRHFGNIISLVLTREPPFQVELFIVPLGHSSFTAHAHPHVDVVEWHLTGDAMLYLSGSPLCDHSVIEAWVRGKVATTMVDIPHGIVHSGTATEPYAFLSIQEWLGGTPPTSVGLDWLGEPASKEQAVMLAHQNTWHDARHSDDALREQEGVGHG